MKTADGTNNVYDLLNDFVNILEDDGIFKAAIVYGSFAMNKGNKLSDIDVIVCTDSPDFNTPEKAYEIIAENAFGKLSPTIKSLQEFSPKNYVTMNWRYLEHLNNVTDYSNGKNIIVDKGVGIEERLRNMWERLKDDSRLEIANKVGAGLVARHKLLNICKGNISFALSDDFDRIKLPSKISWEGAIDALKINTYPEDEGKSIQKFYEIMGPENCQGGSYEDYLSIRGRAEVIDKEIKNDGFLIENDGFKRIDYTRVNEIRESFGEEIKRLFADFKSLVERDMEIFKNYLNKHPNEKYTV